MAGAPFGAVHAVLREDLSYEDGTILCTGRDFERNLRAIDVLIDQEAVRNGPTGDVGWKYYDLGHGYCTYDFFDQCPHRMACAKCSFYSPKPSARAQLMEGKANLLRLRQEIPLQEAEVAAVDDG